MRKVNSSWKKAYTYGVDHYSKWVLKKFNGIKFQEIQIHVILSHCAATKKNNITGREE